MPAGDAPRAAAGARNPFAPPRGPSGGANAQPRDYYFDGLSFSTARLPGIRVSGLMSYGGRVKVCADVEGLGPVVLGEGDRLVLPAARDAKTSAYLVVQKISKDSMTIVLDDGSVIQGKYY